MTEAEPLVALHADRLPGGHGKLETAVRGRQWAAEGLLVRQGVLPINGVTGWMNRMEAHMYRAWLIMRSHA